MIFRHKLLDKQLEWTEQQHCCELVVESSRFLRRLLKDISSGEGKEISITEEGEPIVLGKQVDLIFNPLRLDFNNRRVTTALLKMLVKTSLSEDFYLSTNTLRAKIVKYLDEIVEAEDFTFEVSSVDDFSIDAIAKAANLHIVGDEDDFIALLVDYLTVMAELGGIRLFVFVNLRALMTEDELLRFCHDLDNHQLDVLLIESQDRGKRTAIQRILIDKDDCEI